MSHTQTQRPGTSTGVGRGRGSPQPQPQQPRDAGGRFAPHPTAQSAPVTPAAQQFEQSSGLQFTAGTSNPGVYQPQPPLPDRPPKEDTEAPNSPRQEIEVNVRTTTAQPPPINPYAEDEDSEYDTPQRTETPGPSKGKEKAPQTPEKKAKREPMTPAEEIEYLKKQLAEQTYLTNVYRHQSYTVTTRLRRWLRH